MRERSAAGDSSGGGLTMVTVGAVRRGVVTVVMRGARWLLLLLKGGRRVVGVGVKRTKRKEGECSRRCECKSVFGCR